MNTFSHDEFLADLYAMDPGLREHEAELIPLIERLLKSDPAKSPDPAFVAKLRSQLSDRAATMDVPEEAPHAWNLSWLLGGALTAAVLIPVAFVAYKGINTTTPPSDSNTPTFAFHIEDAKENAFGPLSDISPAATGAPSARAQSGGGGMGGGVSNPAPMAATEPYGERDAKMIAPYPVYQYEYIYDGKLPELTATVPVYKRDSSSKSLPLSAISSRLNLGMLDLDSFAGMNIDSLSFTQNVPFGYQLFVSLRDSSISLDAQWDQWPQSKCTTDACYQKERVTLADIPAEDQLIAIAKDFTSSHAIDLSHYGEPEVDMQWKKDYERAPNKADAYVPDTIRVVFPLLIDGKASYDQSGMTSGISIGVNVKHKKVMNAYGIMDRTYIKSEYAGVTEESAIKTFLTKLDNYGAIPVDSMPGGQTVKHGKVILGEPVVSYSMYYRYTSGTNDELLVPSLIFPIEKVEGGEEGFFYRTSVVVPLAKEMLSEQNGMGIPRPMMDGAMVK